MQTIPLPCSALKVSEPINTNQALCFYISTKRMSPGSSSFQGLFKTDEASTDARWFSILITAIAHIIQNPKYCMDDENDNTHTFVDATGSTVDKTTQFIETVKSSDGVFDVGYRIWIFNHIPNQFDFCKGMKNLIIENLKFWEQKHLGKTVPQYCGDTFRQMTSAAFYATYVNTWFGKGSRSGSDLHHVSDPSNNIAITNAFSIYSSFKQSSNDSVNVQQNSIINYQHQDNGETYFLFPYPHLVFKLPSASFQPYVLVNLELPRTSSLHNPVVENYTDSQVNSIVLQGLNAAAAPPRVADTIVQESELTAMGHQNRDEYREVMAKLIDSDDDEIFETIKKWRMDKLHDFYRMWKNSRNISEPLLVMRSWINGIIKDNVQKTGDATFHVSRPIKDCEPLDSSLTPFGNFLARRVRWFGFPYECISNHMVVLFMSFARLDAYRREFELHVNWLLTGSGNAGKTFACRQIYEHMCIPRTASEIGHETAKANTVCHNQLDGISFYNEMPDHLLGISGNQMSNTGDYLMKNALDSCKMNTKAFHVEESTGERTFKYSESEFIRVVGGCTNEPPQIIPEALLQRFIVIMVHDHNVVNKRKIDHELRATMSKDSTKEFKHEINQFFRTEQYIYCVAEKLIWCKILPEIDESIFSMVFRDIEKYAGKKGVNPSASFKKKPDDSHTISSREFSTTRFY